MKMIATKAHRYGGQRIAKDQEFNASRRDAPVLAAVKRARPVEEVALPSVKKAPAKTAATRTRALSAEDTGRDASTGVAGVTKRQYKRRDLTPES